MMGRGCGRLEEDGTSAGISLEEYRCLSTGGERDCMRGEMSEGVLWEV